jgi:hypothetical protein
MGASDCYLNNLSFALTLADWISLIGIIINSILAYWIVRTIQNKLTNKRVLKDHFISEIKEIRGEYKEFLNNLYSSKIHSGKVIPWFKLMNIKVDNILDLAVRRYRLDNKALNPYQNQLRDLITDNVDFINQFGLDVPLNLSQDSKNQLIRFQQQHNHLFNEIIIKINDA